MKDFTPRPIDLDSEMVAYLEDVAKTYGLPDIGKAVRCLVNYARENDAKRDEIFNEIRCTGC
ncbi:MAG TPA: hypothetical protein VH436_27760 [Vicinamibacterales bacterium]|jgi:hypothetical protein